MNTPNRSKKLVTPKKKPSRFSCMNVVVHTQNGGPFPESEMKRIEDALAKSIEHSKVPLLSSVIKE